MSVPVRLPVSPRQSTPRVLLLAGGWEGHDPRAMGDFAQHEVLRGCDVTRTDQMDVFNLADLARFDVLVPWWTFGEITSAQEHALLSAVAGGLGLVAWHSLTSAWLASRATKHLIGAQFVAHPGGDDVEYEVECDPGHPLVNGGGEGEGSSSTSMPIRLRVRSEQYYLLVDPAVRPFAWTTIQAPNELPWLRGVRMPVGWTREWGRGRVMYCSIGHRPSDLRTPMLLALLQRAVAWAAAGRAESERSDRLPKSEVLPNTLGANLEPTIITRAPADTPAHSSPL